jgi:chaperone modulatory protein CbpM
MNESKVTVTQGVLVEEAIEFTLVELSRACQVEREQLVALIEEGVLEPSGADREAWRFHGAALRRARSALRLTRDLELNPAAAALVLDLLDEIAALKSQLQRRGR